MNKTQKSTFVAVLLLLAGSIPLDAEEPRSVPSADFARDVLPILSNKCFICHGPDARKKNALRLDTYAGATRDLGGYRAIDPTTLEKSEILTRIHDADEPMPPKDAEKQLTPQERAILSQWIREGGQYAQHWAFVPPRKQVPTLKGNFPSNNIDSFILARLQDVKLDFAPEADRATLARRAALVLTGLPPEPKQLLTFLADTKDEAYERFVDELLSSTRYGEHQARYWLDAVRYGDTHGLHLDNRRGIYPYRDWVVHALNNNVPFDDFITWQLAGDLLPDPTLEQQVATGFVRMNPTTSEGGAIPAEFQAKNNFDRVETLGTVLLGMSLTCARCHTHKYDPIPQQEYYNLLAFFNSTAENAMDGNSYTYGPVVKAPQNLAAWKNWDALERERDRLLTKAGLANEGQRQNQLAGLANAEGPFAGTPLQKEAQALIQRIKDAEASFTTTLVARDLPQPRTTQVLSRGEYDLPIGDALRPGILSVMGAFPEDAPRNRLGLAEWLMSRKHPLVSRVLVNQIWQRVFGHGLVRTPEDFGLQGEQPTHPALLDWLAVEFQDADWDLKHLLRMMVTSQTFRQSSRRRGEVDDPENRLFARGPFYRLDAEVLRDIAMWSSGLLNSNSGGEGVKPYQPEGLWEALAHPGSNTKNYVPDKGEKLYRRSLYVYWKRTSPHPIMTLFDAPSRESSCVKRSRTNTPLQSLALFNEPQRLEAARALANRLLHHEADDVQRLNQLFHLVACREPNKTERAACEALLRAMRQRYADAPKDAEALLARDKVPEDSKADLTEHAAWTQVVITVLGSDVAILLY